MLTLRDILLGVLLPFGLALVVLLIGWRPWRRDRKPLGGGFWSSALAVSVAFIAGALVTPHLVRFPPTEGHDWLVAILPLVSLLALLDGLFRLPLWLRIVLAAIACGAAVGAVLWPLTAQAWNTEQYIVRAGTASAALLVCWLFFDLVCQRRRGVGMPLIMCLASVAAALVLMDSGSQRYAQLTGMVAAALGAAVLAALRSDLSLAQGGALITIIVLGGLIVCGHFYADVTRRDELLLATVPLVVWAGELPFLRHSWQRLVVRLVAVLVPLSIVAVPAIRGLIKTASNELDLGY